MAMNKHKEINAFECTFLNLNDTCFSNTTKNSAEKEFKELEALISTIVKEDKENLLMISSCKLIDKSNSILSNDEIWEGDRSHEDSKHFEENFKKINHKKTRKINKLEINNKEILKDSNKITSAIKITKAEDYNDDIEESIETTKNEHVNRLKIKETKDNNLNEKFLNHFSENPLKFYTSPDDVTDYRSCYPLSNFSFTPQSQLNINNMQKNNIFPTIPDNYTFYNNDSARNIKQSYASDNKGNDCEQNKGNEYVRKYYTPTHQISHNIMHQKELVDVQKKLDFNNISSNQSNTQNNMVLQDNTKQPNSNKNINKFNPRINSFQTSNLKIPNLFLNNRMNSLNNTNSVSENKLTGTYSINDEKSPNTRVEELFDHNINLDNIILGKDKRTILMIRNVPNKYTLTNIVDEINTNFLGKYDYINLLVDNERKLNLGYAFINFVDPLHIVLFYDAYFHKKWNRYRSDKKIQLNYAEKQAKKDISCKDENTYFAKEDKKINFGKINSKIEIPFRFYDYFKKIYPNSVCIVENKNSIASEKRFYVKALESK